MSQSWNAVAAKLTSVMNKEKYCYVGVWGNPDSDSGVYNLNSEERMSIPFSGTSFMLDPIVMFKEEPLRIINALGELGYQVICSCPYKDGIFWTLQRKLEDQQLFSGL